MPKVDNSERFKKKLIAYFIEGLKAAANGNPPRNFRDLAVDDAKSVITMISGSSPIPGTDLATKVVSKSIDYLMKGKKDKQKKIAAEALDIMEDNPEKTELDMKMLAMNAALRYQFFIQECLDPKNKTEGVDEFARVGAERMLSHLLAVDSERSTEESLTVDEMLYGLTYQPSGGFVSAELKNHQVQTINKGKFTAEGAYQRSGYTDPMRDVNDNKDGYIMLKKVGGLDKTNLSSDGKPKYGYMNMTLREFFRLDELNDKEFEGEAKAEHRYARVERHYNPNSIPIGRPMIESYLAKPRPGVSLLAYCKSEMDNDSATQVFFTYNEPTELDFKGLDFSGRDLSNTVFNGCTFHGSLEDTKFNNSYLINADFTNVTSAKRADFNSAQLGGLNAANVNFKDSNFYKSENLSVNFSGANITGCKHLCFDRSASYENTIDDHTTENLHARTEELQTSTEELQARLDAQHPRPKEAPDLPPRNYSNEMKARLLKIRAQDDIQCPQNKDKEIRPK